MSARSAIPTRRSSSRCGHGSLAVILCHDDPLHAPAPAETSRTMQPEPSYIAFDCTCHVCMYQQSSSTCRAHYLKLFTHLSGGGFHQCAWYVQALRQPR